MLLDSSPPKWCPWNRTGATRGFLEICNACRKRNQRPAQCQMKVFMRFTSLVSIILLIYMLVWSFSP
jgi:hypothetical protein